MSNLSPQEQQELTEVLTNLGLSLKEQRVYLAVHSSGNTTLSNTASTCKLPISTTQAILERIVAKGFVDIIKVKSKNTYQAKPPKDIKLMMQTKVEEVTGILPLLESLAGSAHDGAKVTVYERERLTDVFLASLECKSKHVYEIVSAKHIQELLGEKFHYTRRRLKAGVHLKSLRVETHEIKTYNKDTHRRELREAKFLPRAMNFEASILIWDDTVAIFSTKREGTAVVIESKSIREMMQQLFEVLWEVSRRMETT